MGNNNFIRAISDTRAIRNLLRAARRVSILLWVLMAAIVLTKIPLPGFEPVFGWVVIAVWAVGSFEAIRVIRAINVIFSVENRNAARDAA